MNGANGHNGAGAGRGSVRAYSRHRGCSHTAVTKALRTGRLKASVTIVDGRPLVDFALADGEWRKNTDVGKQRHPSPAEPNGARLPVSFDRLFFELEGDRIVVSWEFDGVDDETPIDAAGGWLAVDAPTAEAIARRLQRLAQMLTKKG